MNIKLLIALIALPISLYAQSVKAILYKEAIVDGSAIFVDNDEYCPVSVQLNLKLTNMKSTEGNNKIFVVPARTKKHKITEVLISNQKKAFGFGLETTIGLGDNDLKTYDENFKYSLPYKKGAAYTITQGYNGKYTHQNENSLDFDMPVGVEICAVREGIVVKTEDNNNKHCMDEKCKEYDNYILIYQPDGTFASYSHLKKKGVLVKEGDKIIAGQVIGYSGFVGYASGPHLHFDISTFNLKNQKTVKTYFLVGNGADVEYLQEHKKYERNY